MTARAPLPGPHPGAAQPLLAPHLPQLPPGKHWLGRCGGVTAIDVVCRHGARSPAQCGQPHPARVAIVLGGLFQMRSPLGDAVLAPGALFGANPGDAYEFRHVDDGGDRTLVFELDESVLADAERSLERPRRRGGLFTHATAPPAPEALPAIVHAHAALRARSPELLREAALLALEHAATARAAPPPLPPLVSLRRLARAIRHVEAHCDEDCSLDALAAHARLSPFHLVRVFRAATGQTPHQFVLATRLRAAEALLRTTSRPITQLALDVGFGDLTNFGAAFRRAFGLPPRAYRARTRS